MKPKKRASILTITSGEHQSNADLGFLCASAASAQTYIAGESLNNVWVLFQRGLVMWWQRGGPQTAHN